MKNTTLLFDMDGTLNDSAPGMKHCAMQTLEDMHLPIIPYEKLNFFIGPPLRDCFRLCHVPEERIEEAVKIYRSYYEKTGKYEGYVYPGIPELLNTLKEEGYPLFICTSKADFLATDIAEHFQYRNNFKGIYGAKMDGSLAEKKDIIHACISNNPTKHFIMIGDTYLDILGANENHIDSIGVSWGYGDKKTMLDHHPTFLVNSIEELLSTIRTYDER